MKIIFRANVLLVFLFAGLTGGLLACQDDATRAAEHFERAKAYVEQEDFDKAIIEYRNVLQISPKEPEAHYGLAKAYIGAKKFSDGYWWLSETVRIDPENWDARMEYGEISRLGGKLEESLAQADAVIQGDPDRVDAYVLKARSLVGLKRGEEARESFEKAIEKEPGKAVYRVQLATYLTGTGNREDAEPLLRKAIEVEPNFVSYLAWGGFLARDDARFDEAAAAYSEALKNAEPEQLELGYQVLGNFYFAHKRFDDAEAILKKGIEETPESVQLVYLLARFYNIHGDKEKADAMMEAATKVTPDEVAPYLTLSLYRYRAHDFDGALEAADQAIQVKPDDESARLRKAELLIEKGYNDDIQEMIAEGRNIVETVLSENPESPQALYLKARLNLAEGDNPAALAGLRQVVEKKPDWAQAHFLLGTALFRDKDLQGARAELARAVELNDSLGKAHKLLARVHVDLGETEFALEEGQKALAQDPDDTESRTMVAQNLVRSGKLSQAMALLEEVPEEKRDVGIYFALGRIALAQRDPKVSRKYLEKAAEMEPGNWKILLSLLNLDRFEQTLDQSSKRIAAAIEDKPGDANLFYVRGVLAMMQEDTAAAEEDFRRSIELASDGLLAYQGLAAVLTKSGRRAELIDTYEKALAAQPDSKASIYFMLGSLYETDGKLDKAIENYESALKENDNLVAAKNNLAYLLTETGRDLDRALELAQSAKALAADNPNIADTLGWVLYKKGIASAALTYFEEAKVGTPIGGPSRSVIQYHIALAHDANGDAELARKVVGEALEAYAAFSKKEAEKAEKKDGVVPPEPKWVSEARELQTRLKEADAG